MVNKEAPLQRKPIYENKDVKFLLQSEELFYSLCTWHHDTDVKEMKFFFYPARAVTNLSFHLQHVWGCYVVMIVNSKGVWKDVLSEDLRSLPFNLTTPSTPSPGTAFQLQGGWLLCLPKPTECGRRRGVAAQSGATAALATTTRYMIIDHRHAPPPNTTAA